MELKNWETSESHKNTIHKNYKEFLVSITFIKGFRFEVAIVHDPSNNLIEEVSFDNFFDAIKFAEDFLEIE